MQQRKLFELDEAPQEPTVGPYEIQGLAPIIKPGEHTGFDPKSVERLLAGRTPRPYQVEAVVRAYEQLDGGSRGTLLRAPTGTGKSFMCALAIREWLSRSDKHRVLVGLHDISLINQMARELRGFLGIAVGVEQASRQINMESDFHPKVIVGSRASLGVREVENEDGEKLSVTRLSKFDPWEYQWLIIPDECHRWRWNLPSCKPLIEWFDQSPYNKRLGLSATPERSDKAKFNKLFPSVCLDMTYSKAVDEGWIVPYRQTWVNLKHVTIKNPESIKDQKELDKCFDEFLSDARFIRGVTQPVVEKSEGRRTLVFCPDVRSCYAVAADINEMLGTDAAVATHGGVRKDLREEIYYAFKRGDFRFLCVCALCREGFDDPSLGAVAILRYIKSRGLAEQMKGRVARVLPGTIEGLDTPAERKAAIAASLKPDGLIIDVTGVSGLGEVPSTVDILAEGMPDGVMQIARKKAKEAESEGREISPEKILEEAEKEYKNFIEEAERRAAKIRSKLDIEVEYDTRIVGNGEGGAPNKQGHKKGGATPKQVELLEKLGVKRETAEGFTRGQAGAVIDKRLSLEGAAYRITFGKYAGKALGELPDRYISMMQYQHEADGAFSKVMPHIERMEHEREEAWRNEYDGAFRQFQKPEPIYQEPVARRATDAQKRLAARYGFPEPKTFEDGVEIVNQVNGGNK